MIPQKHQEFINTAADILKKDERVVGIALCGSYITGDMDEYSDLDFMVAVEPSRFEEVASEKITIAEKLGDLLSAFTGAHIGVPNLLICLYGSPLIHVDLNFIPLDKAGNRFEDASILYDKDECLTKTYRNTEPYHSVLDLQWLEDRFWVWMHYTASKIGRGELCEALDAISFIRATVLGPLLQVKKGRPPRGVRHLERDAPEYMPLLLKTVPDYDACSCIRALKGEMELYRMLRQPLESTIIRREKAELAAVNYLNEITELFLDRSIVHNQKDLPLL